VNRAVRAVLFDFYGTLARAVTWGPTFEEVLAGRGLILDPDALERWRAEGADGVDHGEHSVDRDTYVAWERARLRRLVGVCGAGADADACVEELYTATKAYTLAAYEEVPEVLAALRSARVTVAVCSNWDWDLEHALGRAGLDGVADVVVTSAQAGARKPHPRIYHHTLERCGVEPADALFVGDTWGPDVEGPAGVGMRPVHVWRPENDGRDVPPAGDVPRIGDLRGVLDLVPDA
jgi:putative hydrolase of the HAD superfamily